MTLKNEDLAKYLSFIHGIVITFITATEDRKLIYEFDLLDAAGGLLCTTTSSYSSYIELMKEVIQIKN